MLVYKTVSSSESKNSVTTLCSSRNCFEAFILALLLKEEDEEGSLKL